MMSLRFPPSSPWIAASSKRRPTIANSTPSQIAQKVTFPSAPLFGGPGNSTGTGPGNWTSPSQQPRSTSPSSGYGPNDPVPVIEGVSLGGAALVFIGIILYLSRRQNKQQKPSQQSV